MSTSLNVVNDAAVFCESFNLSEILARILFIFTRRSSREPADDATADFGASATFCGADGAGADFGGAGSKN